MEEMSVKLKWLSTIVLLITFFLYSLCWNSFFSTLLDFQEILATTTDKISFGLSVRSAGSCIGALGGSILYNHTNRDITYAVFLIIMGMVAVIIPRITDLIWHLFLQSIVGLAVGVIEVGGNVKILLIWKEKGGPFLQALSAVWTSGGAIVPLLLEPFLSPTPEENRCKTSNLTECRGLINANNETKLSLIENSTKFTSNYTATEKSESIIWLPYTVLGVSLVISGLIALLIPLFSQIEKAKKKSEKQRNIELNNVEGEKSELMKKAAEESITKFYKYGCVALCCLLLFIFYGFSDTTWQYWIPFVVRIDLKLDKPTGLHMLSAMNTAFAITNLSGIFLAAKIKPFTLLMFLTSLLTCGNLIHFFFCNTSLTLLWVGAIVEAIGFGCIYATTFNYLQLKVGITNTLGSLLVFAAWFANGMGYSLLIGYFIEQYPMTLIYTNIFSIAVIIFCLFGLYFLEKRVKCRN
ncbi:sodium-dependent glucose transporter 1-like protein [Dinothrombium tinctorium]|uniref:Sodium-dependent glucose transporter 1-like protein n=1 Tax=Dinothrombium tinctorium TaxID=1965070 RepID=A0A3S3PKE5_9ACAR|nr:sodium-dependent glucose transporter 1-like protein [Dinothrombium tinctorium]